MSGTNIYHSTVGAGKVWNWYETWETARKTLRYRETRFRKGLGTATNRTCAYYMGIYIHNLYSVLPVT